MPVYPDEARFRGNQGGYFVGHNGLLSQIGAIETLQYNENTKLFLFFIPTAYFGLYTIKNCDMLDFFYRPNIG